MNNNELMMLATYVAEKLSIKIKDMKKISNDLSKTHGDTTILRNGNYIIWIDKYYIAYSATFEPQVYYAYLTKKHIKEDLPLVLRQLQTAKNDSDIKTLLSIRNQFLSAQAIMNETGINYVKTNQLEYVWSKSKIKIPTNAFVLTLCHSCTQNFRSVEKRFVDRVDYEQQEKDVCSYCNCRNGYDYAIWNKE